MPKIHKYQDISEIDREAKRDLMIDTLHLFTVQILQ